MTDKSAPLGSGQMFDGIASTYDAVNRISSLGLDLRWRRALADHVFAQDVRDIIDLATGTADVAIELADRDPRVQVTAIDPSIAMLRHAQDKQLPSNIRIVQGCGETLPLDDEAYDAITISFGIRNFVDRPQSLRECLRVLRPGGRLLILELVQPTHGLGAALVRMQTNFVIPLIGGILGHRREYVHLDESMARFPPPKEFASEIESAGFKQVTITSFLFGTVNLFVATKPS